jgi:hypothetical protein
MLKQFIQWSKETSNTPEHLARSYLFLRKSVGVIGIATPFVLVIGTMILGNSFVIKDSISSYYYTVTGNIFVGSMCASAIFLICYRYEHLDDFVSTAAGAFAIGVALFPTAPTGQQTAIGWAHGFFAAFFIFSLAIMARIFRKTDPDPTKKPTCEKLLRNKVYLSCSITIFACVGLLILIAIIQNLTSILAIIQNLTSIPLLKSFHPILWLESVLWLEWLKPLNPVLWLECIALWAFGFAWFVKGETIWKDPPKEGIPAPGGVWNSKTRVVASTLGILAGLLGVIHGIFEIIQGNVAPSGVFMLAVGPPCQANRVWHQCFPAMTIIPNFFVTGVLAIIVSLLIFLWAAVFVQRKNGGLFLILLSIIQLLVGGGFISPELGIISGVVGTRIKVPFKWWRVQLSDRSQRRLEKGWPWFLRAFLFVLAAYVILGSLFNDFLLSLTLLPLFFALGLLLLAILTVLTVLSGFAYDIQRQTDDHRALSAGMLPQPQDGAR